MSFENIVDYCPAKETKVVTGPRRGKSLGGATVSHECAVTGFTIETTDTPPINEAHAIIDARLGESGICENCEFRTMTPDEYQEYLQGLENNNRSLFNG